jgi:propionyl-CoA synthetase
MSLAIILTAPSAIGEVPRKIEDGFVIAKDPSKTSNMEAEVMKTVDSQLGAVARPARVYLVSALPKTRSGKIVRRALQAVAEGRDPGDISTMEDQSVLAQIKQVIGK